jgi:hypothetical protein
VREIMPKILITAAVASMLASSCAHARGGGNSSPWESPYAILEPQTVAPQTFPEPEGTEWRSTFENDRPQSYSVGVHHHRSHRRATTLER